MSIQIYKPNRNNNGFAFSFYIGETKNKPTLFLNAIAQHSWDDKKRLGSFSENKNNPDKNISIKFNEFECGAIISAISNRFEWSTYHSFEENKTQIRLTPWDKKVKSTKINQKTKEAYDSEVVIPAFGLSITRNGNQNFKIPLEPGEAEVIKILCQTILVKISELSIYAPQQKKSTNSDYDF